MAESSRERTISVANDLFFAHGFHAVGLDQILDRVGVTKTTFYKHFQSKDDLVIAVLQERDRRETAEWLELMRERGRNDPRAELLALFDLLEEWLGHPEFRGCMFLRAVGEFPSPNDPVHQAALAHGRHLYEQMADRAGRAGAADPDALANQLMLVLTGAILSRTTSGEPDRARSARAAAGALIDSQVRTVSMA